MVRIRNGIFGPIHGKLGNLVGATWKNIPYLRVLPNKLENGKTGTPAQIACREKFKFVTEWLVPFYAYTVGVYPDLSIDYSKVVLRKGGSYMNAQLTLNLGLLFY